MLPTDATVLAVGLDVVGVVAVIGHASAAVLAVGLDVFVLLLVDQILALFLRHGRASLEVVTAYRGLAH